MEAPDGQSVALVACDLWSVPALLDARVGDLLASNAETAHLGSSRILLSATHTHHSQAAYSTSHAHNLLASPKMGFDPNLFEFLARRIAGAVTAAVVDREPAELRYGSKRANGVFCNRSFEPFLANGPAALALIAANADLDRPPATAEFPFPDAFRALDPTVRVVRIDRSGHSSIVLAMMASHTITLPAACELYSPELPGPARSRAEETLAARGTVATVVLFNGAEGDVSTAWSGQDRRSTARLARRLGESIADAAASAREPSTELGTDIGLRSTSVALADHPFHDASRTARRTAPYGLPGIAQPGGAEDARATACEEGFKEGVTAGVCCQHELQGGKGSAIPATLVPWSVPGEDCPFDPWLSRIMADVLDPPSTVPLQIISIGSLRIVAVPGETTTMLGLDIRQAVADAEGLDIRAVTILGLTDDYASYFTTPAEYDCQHYEGASMLFGPHAGALLVEEARRLASMSSPLDDIPHGPRCSPCLLRKRFGPDDISGEVDAAWSQVSAALQAEDEDVAPGELPQFTWVEPAHRPSALRLAERVVPDVKVEYRNAAGTWSAVPDDEVTAFARRASCGDVEWIAFWLPPRGASLHRIERRFRVLSVDGTQHESGPFEWVAR